MVLWSSDLRAPRTWPVLRSPRHRGTSAPGCRRDSRDGIHGCKAKRALGGGAPCGGRSIRCLLRRVRVSVWSEVGAAGWLGFTASLISSSSASSEPTIHRELLSDSIGPKELGTSSPSQDRPFLLTVDLFLMFNLEFLCLPRALNSTWVPRPPVGAESLFWHCPHPNSCGPYIQPSVGAELWGQWRKAMKWLLFQKSTVSVFTVALGEYRVPSAARDFWTCQSGKQIRAPLGVSVQYLYWMNGPTPTPHRREGGSYWGRRD